MAENVTFEYVFPAIRGIQAGQEYYTSMCPLRLIPKIFLFNEEEIAPEMRAQRTINRARVPEMARYILDNPKSYVFSALTASIDGDVTFDPFDALTGTNDIGRLRVPMSARFLINDGQHRRAAIEEALKDNPSMGDETISIVFFRDVGLARSQQMFADLNRYAVRATHSIGILYDHRDEQTKLTKEMIRKVELFHRLTEYEKSSLSARSGKLFTLSSIHGATRHLIEGTQPDSSYDDLLKTAYSFWKVVCVNMTDWRHVAEKKVSAGEVRQDSISCHAVALAAIGKAGRTLLDAHKDDWAKRLKPLQDIDWSRRNASVWEGRALIGGQVSKSRTSVALTTSYLKQRLNLPLTPEERRLESNLKVNQRS